MANESPVTGSAETFLVDEAAQLAFGARLADCLQPGTLVALHGDLGAGKTTLVRGVLQGLGYRGRVRSPTFTLLEAYDTTKPRFCHLDLYRLADLEELELIGIRDYLDGDWSVWVEWPQRVPELLAQADADIHIDYSRGGRRVHIEARTASGALLLEYSA